LIVDPESLHFLGRPIIARAARCISLFAFSLWALSTAHAATINVPADQPTIQAGINAAANGDTVLVAPGTYNENIDFNGKAITVNSSGGAAATIIDGGAAPGLAVVAFQSNEQRTSILSNFTVRNGGAVTFTSRAGGGIYISAASPTILNNIITENQCNGIDVAWGAALIQGNTISATMNADNAYCSFEPVALVLEGNQSNTTMYNSVIGNTIENNQSSGDSAAAIFIWASNGNIIVGNTIRNNVSSQGAVQMYNSESIIFSQNLVYDNSVSGDVVGYDGAGGLYLAVPDGGPPFYGVMVNNTFANNTTPSGAFNQPASQVLVDGDVSEFSFVNNVIYGTGSSPLLICNGVYAYLSPGPMLVENNDVFNPSGPAYDPSCANGAGMAGNIAVDPLFKNPASNDFHLQSGSSAIDVGNNQAVTMLTPYGVDLTTDFDGNPRVQDATGKGCIIDMGAYEYPGTLSDCGGSPTSETLTSSLNPAMVGQSITFTAQLSGASGTPTGAIQFLDGASLLSTQPVSGTGSATFSTNSLAAGSHTITANYVPSGSWQSSSATLVEVINGKPTTTILSAAPNPAYALQQVTLSAQVSATGGGAPSGTVTFFDGSSAIGSASVPAGGVVTLTVSFPVASATPLMLTASYSGDAQFSASTSAAYAETIQLNPTTTVLVSIVPNPVGAYLSTTLTANVSSSTRGSNLPTGTVSFNVPGSWLGTASVQGGIATFTENAGPAGVHPVTAIYGGNPEFAGSSSASTTLTVTPEPSTVSLTSSRNPSTFGSIVTFTAVVSAQGVGIPLGGTYTFFDGSTQLSQPAQSTNGSASYSTASLALGIHPITVVYSGNSNVQGSSSAVLNQTVVAYTGDFTLSVNPGAGNLYTGQSGSFTVTATPQNGFNLPLTLSCSGLPANVTCAFAPGSLPSGQIQSMLVLQTAAPVQATSTRRVSGGAAVLAAIFCLLYVPRRFRRALSISSIFLAIFAICSGCSSPGSLTVGTPPGTYQITVIAQTSAAGPQLSHSITINLTVKSLF